MTVPTFGGRRPDRTRPIEFRLQAAPATGDGQLVEETFRARPTVNWSTISHLFAQAGGGLEGVNRFFATVLLPDDAKKFRAMVDDPDLYLEAADLDAAAQWLIGEYAERPTTPPAGSPDGRNPDGLTSEVKPYSPAAV